VLFAVTRVGEKVPFAKKGRFGVVSGSVEEFFCPFHLQIETSSTDDLDEELLMQKVADSFFAVYLFFFVHTCITWFKHLTFCNIFIISFAIFLNCS